MSNDDRDEHVAYLTRMAEVEDAVEAAREEVKLGEEGVRDAELQAQHAKHRLVEAEDDLVASRQRLAEAEKELALFDG